MRRKESNNPYSSNNPGEDSPKFGQIHPSGEERSSALNAKQGFAGAVENRANLRERMLYAAPEPLIPI